MKRALPLASVLLILLVLCLASASATSATTGLTGPAAGRNGYYRFPAIHGDTIVFTSEGDLWSVDIKGGTARRLTTHAGLESERRHLARRADDRLLRPV